LRAHSLRGKKSPKSPSHTLTPSSHLSPPSLLDLPVLCIVSPFLHRAQTYFHLTRFHAVLARLHDISLTLSRATTPWHQKKHKNTDRSRLPPRLHRHQRVSQQQIIIAWTASTRYAASPRVNSGIRPAIRLSLGVAIASLSPSFTKRSPLQPTWNQPPQPPFMDLHLLQLPVTPSAPCFHHHQTSHRLRLPPQGVDMVEHVSHACQVPVHARTEP
jgi:hypothetical protein